MGQEGFSEEVAFVRRPEWGERASCIKVWGTVAPGSEKSKCQGPAEGLVVWYAWGIP